MAYGRHQRWAEGGELEALRGREEGRAAPHLVQVGVLAGHHAREVALADRCLARPADLSASPHATQVVRGRAPEQASTLPCNTCGRGAPRFPVRGCSRQQSPTGEENRADPRGQPVPARPLQWATNHDMCFGIHVLRNEAFRRSGGDN